MEDFFHREDLLKEDFLKFNTSVSEVSVQNPLILVFINDDVSNYDVKSDQKTVFENDKESLLSFLKDCKFDIAPDRLNTSSELAENVKPFEHLKTVMDNCRKNQLMDGFDSLILCLLSYSNDKKKIFFQSDEVTIDLIVNYFRGHNCPSLIGKPKLFLISTYSGLLPKMRPQAVPPARKVPIDADFIILYADIPMEPFCYKGVTPMKSLQEEFKKSLETARESHHSTELSDLVTLARQTMVLDENFMSSDLSKRPTFLQMSTMSKLVFLAQPTVGATSGEQPIY